MQSFRSSRLQKRLKEGKSIEGINGTCVISKEVPPEFDLLPSFYDVANDKKAFCRMQNMFDINRKLAQKFDNRYVLQYKAMPYTTKDLDYIYSLPFSRSIPRHYKEFRVVEWSVLTHRGCLGGCNFCSNRPKLRQGVVSRSRESIIEEIKWMTHLPGFKGVVELSGASANMYGMDCASSDACKNRCVTCKQLNKSHQELLRLMRSIRNIHGVRKVFVKSGVRYDLAMNSPEYIRELVKYHIDGKMMVAPEHMNREVLKLMNKDNEERKVHDFIKMFRKICEQEKKPLDLSYYLLVGHPGCTIGNSDELRIFVKNHTNTNFVQIFTPTPMTVSTCIYYTGIDPKTMNPVYVPYTYNEKKKQKNIALGRKAAEERRR